MSELTEEDWKVVEARLQYDIDNNVGMDLKLGILQSEKQEEKNE